MNFTTNTSDICYKALFLKMCHSKQFKRLTCNTGEEDHSRRVKSLLSCEETDGRPKSDRFRRQRKVHCRKHKVSSSVATKEREGQNYVLPLSFGSPVTDHMNGCSRKDCLQLIPLQTGGLETLDNEEGKAVVLEKQTSYVHWIFGL